jgi:integrase
MMLLFGEFLQSKSTGEGAKSIYQRFKKFIKYAIEHDIMIKNPCAGWFAKLMTNIEKRCPFFLKNRTPYIYNYENQNQEIRRAFIFCLYTGLRFCDVIALKYNNIDYSNKLLIFEQAKTKGHSTASGVVTPLNDGLLSLIGETSTDAKNDVIFNLPSHTMCLKGLRRWV